MRISLVMLTYNRAALVQRTMAHNMANAGCAIDELIWVDNGSTDHVRDVMATYAPDVCVFNRANLGVSRGYNRGFALATGDFIVITDDDMLMPEGWLALFKTYVTTIPNTGVACIFHKKPTLEFRNAQQMNGLTYYPCYPIDRRFVSRDLLTKKIGYLREDLGLYGWEDIEWGQRAVRVCKQEGLLTYALPARSEHLGTHSLDGPDFVEFKRTQGSDPQKQAVLRRCREQGFPYYNPYA